MKQENEKHPLLRPKKSLGQNFLIDENIARKIIAALEIQPTDAIVEVGPGRGVLTKYLVDSARKVVAVEIDSQLVNQLRQSFGESNNFHLINEDILKLDFAQILERDFQWKMIGNLPYHITSQIFFKLFENREIFHSAIFMIQKEVADRVTAAPNSKDYGILSVFTQFYTEPKKLFQVSRNVFVPKPEVTSAVVSLRMRKNLPLSQEEIKIFTELVKKGFAQRRKILRNSLKMATALPPEWHELNFDFERRPEQLHVEEFVELARQIAGLQFRK